MLHLKPVLPFPSAAEGARERRAGQRGAAGVCQRHPAADSGPLPRHPGAGGQRAGGVILTPRRGEWPGQEPRKGKDEDRHPGTAWPRANTTDSPTR